MSGGYRTSTVHLSAKTPRRQDADGSRNTREKTIHLSMRGRLRWVSHLLTIGFQWRAVSGQYLEGTLQYEAMLEAGTIKLQT